MQCVEVVSVDGGPKVERRGIVEQNGEGYAELHGYVDACEFTFVHRTIISFTATSNTPNNKQ